MLFAYLVRRPGSSPTGGGGAASLVSAPPVVDYASSNAASLNDQFTVHWAVPTLASDLSTATDTITSQTVYYGTDGVEVRKGSSGSGVTSVSVSGAATSRTVTGLTGGTTYFVGVSATTAAGESEVSALWQAAVT